MTAVDPIHADPPWLVELKRNHAAPATSTLGARPVERVMTATERNTERAARAARGPGRSRAVKAEVTVDRTPDTITLEEYRRQNAAPVRFVEPRDPRDSAA
jgi:hypothetical protein